MKEEQPSRALLKKYLDSRCTDEENARVSLWFDSFDDEHATEEFDKQSFIQKLQQHIASDQSRVSSKRKGTMLQFAKMAAAAGIILALGVSIWTYLYRPNLTDETSLAAIVPATAEDDDNDILPGSHFAKLTNSTGVSLLNQDSIFLASPLNSAKDGKVMLETPKSATYQVLLEDGTKVWLNASSKLIFPDRFSDNERLVSLEGEGYFEVAKDANRPFRIMSNGTNIEVLGTIFNLKAYGEDVATSLVEGSVKIYKGGHEALLVPGQEATVRGQEIAVTSTDLKERLAWKRGEFYFDGTNTQQVLQQICIWYNVTFDTGIQLTDDSNFKGAISRHAKLSEVVRILSFATGQKLAIKGREVCLIK